MLRMPRLRATYDSNYISLYDCTLYRLIKEDIVKFLSVATKSEIDDIINHLMSLYKWTLFDYPSTEFYTEGHRLRLYPATLFGDLSVNLCIKPFVDPSDFTYIISDLILLKFDNEEIIKSILLNDINSRLIVYTQDVFDLCKEIFKGCGYDIRYNEARGATILRYDSCSYLKDNVWVYNGYGSCFVKGEFKCTGVKYYIPSVYNTKESNWCLEFENTNKEGIGKLYLPLNE